MVQVWQILFFLDILFCCHLEAALFLLPHNFHHHCCCHCNYMQNTLITAISIDSVRNSCCLCYSCCFLLMLLASMLSLLSSYLQNFSVYSFLFQVSIAYIFHALLIILLILQTMVLYECGVTTVSRANRNWSLHFRVSQKCCLYIEVGVLLLIIGAHHSGHCQYHSSHCHHHHRHHFYYHHDPLLVSATFSSDSIFQFIHIANHLFTVIAAIFV